MPVIGIHLSKDSNGKETGTFQQDIKLMILLDIAALIISVLQDTLPQQQLP